MTLQRIDPDTCAVLLIDVQEKLFPHIFQKDLLLKNVKLLLEAALILNIPIFSSEQYPKGLGHTIQPLQKYAVQPFEKKSFSCFQDKEMQIALKKQKKKHWILCGIEAHICVLQTAKDLLQESWKVIIPCDATSSRSEKNYSIAIDEMRCCGARTTSIETLLFELLRSSDAKEFREISNLVK